VSSVSRVAATKLTPPRPRAGVVERRRLDERLDRLTARQVTFVSAAAGYGKTIAVTSWLRRRGLTAAWVSLDESDDDPAALWMSIAAAIVRAHPDMPPAHARASREDVLSRITAYGRPVLLVLDDFDAVTDARAIASLGRAGRDLPPNLKVIAVTRGHPPIEAPDRLGAPELAFTAAEARELLAGDQGLALSDAEIAALVERTEGWPAGLYLAALWLRGPDAASPPFTAGDRNVTDYVTGEVLDAIDADTRAFLLETSVLGRFSAALADHARGRSDSAALLERVSRANLFLVALDDEGVWFRYHALFGELLRRELALDDAAAAPRLHSRAAEWLLARGMLTDAIDHAHAAGDFATVADQVELHRTELMRDGRGVTLLRWVSRLPDELLLARPDVTVIGALASDAFAGRDERGARLLALAERSRGAHPERWSRTAETVVAILRANEIDGDVAALTVACRRAVALADDGADDFTVAARSMLAHALLLAGDEVGGREVADAALAHPAAGQRPHGYVSALAVLAVIAAGAGDLATARGHADRSLGAAREAGILASQAGSRALFAAAMVHAASGALETAERAFERALRSAAPGGVRRAWMLAELADVRARRGHAAEAREALAAARALVAAARDPGRVAARLDAVDLKLG
jgi:LuxR family maltose regulon positive regulatory protein